MVAKEISLRNTGQEEVPPSAIEIERALLGAIILESQSYDKIASVLMPEMFYNESHKIIFEAIVSLNEKKGVIDLLTVCNRLKSMKKLTEVGGQVFVTGLMEGIASSSHIEEHAMIIKQYYIAREVIKLSQIYGKRAYDSTEDIADILHQMDNSLSELSNIMYRNACTFDTALKSALQDIQDKVTKKTIAFLKTNDKLIDTYIKLSLKKVILICSNAKHGKSQFTMWLMRKLLDNYPDKLSIMWYTFEEPEEKIIRRFIAMDVDLNDDQMQSKGYEITPEDGENIDKAVQNLGKYDIEFITESTKITTIKSEFKLFCRRRLGRYCILIIDNLGLLNDEKKSRTETDDYIAQNVISIREETGALIIALHHIKKDQEDESNLKYGYRPRPKDIKGSTRLRDYANQVLLLNRPGKYKDLVAEETMRWKEAPKSKIMDDSPFNEARFREEFWNMNPKEDKATEAIENLYTETWKKLIDVSKREKDNAGKPLKVGYIIKKYQDYINYWESRQSGREVKYQKEKVSIYTFLKKKMYNNSYSTGRTARDEYLYGDIVNPMGLLPELFIVDNAVNRDGSNEGVLRFKHKLDYCKFEDLNYSNDV